jgi:putative peptidoglycan lipid II flippase
VVALFAISIFAQALIQILVRGFYALYNTRTPLAIGSLAVLLNVSLSFVLVYQLNFGVLGLALAISLASFFQAVFLLFFLDRAVNGFVKSQLIIPFFKMSAATILTGFGLWIPLRLLDRYVLNTAKTFDLLILTLTTLIIGLFVYLALSKLFKIKQLNSFLHLLRRAKNLQKILSQTEAVLA